MSAVLPSLENRLHSDDIQTILTLPGSTIQSPTGTPRTVPSDGDASRVLVGDGDDLNRGACGAWIAPAVGQELRAEMSGFDDDTELGDSDSTDDEVAADEDDLDEFDEIDDDDFDDEFDDDFEEELEDEYEIEIEDEISAEFGLGPDKDDDDEELDDLDSLADDLDDLDSDDLKD